MERTLDRLQMTIFAEAIHRGDDGHIAVAAKSYKGEFKMRFFQGTEELLAALRDTYSAKWDIYLSINSFYLPIRRTEALRRINAIYADIDYLPLHTGESFDRIYMPMMYDLVDPGRVPHPSLVIESGNGLHLYWLIEDVPGKMSHPFWQAVAGSLSNVLRQWMKQFEDIAKLDVGVSKDSQRLMRLPGTYNQECGRMCRIVVNHSEDIYRLDQLRDRYGLGGQPRRRKAFTPAASISFYEKLLNDLTKLRDLRLMASRDLWCRRRMTFYYRHFALLAGYDEETALEKTRSFNRGFVKPMTDGRLKAHTLSAQTAFDQGIAYRYRITTLVEELGITHDEMKHMGALVDDITRQERRRAYRRARYGGRDHTGLTAKQRDMAQARALISEWVKQGKTQAEIARLTGFTLSKVKRLRAERKASHETSENKPLADGLENGTFNVCDLTLPGHQPHSAQEIASSRMDVEDEGHSLKAAVDMHVVTTRDAPVKGVHSEHLSG